MTGLGEPPEDLDPEWMARAGRDECVADDPVESRREDPVADVPGRLQPQDQLAALEKAVDGTEALEVQVDVDASEVVHHEVSHHIGTEDRPRVAPIDRQEPGIMATDELQDLGVGPEPIVPVRLKLAPGSPQSEISLRDRSILPRLVENRGDGSGRSAPHLLIHLKWDSVQYIQYYLCHIMLVSFLSSFASQAALT